MEPERKLITITCQHCGADFEIYDDQILQENDWTEAFDDIYKVSIQCPICLERNILETKGIDGKVTKY